MSAVPAGRWWHGLVITAIAVVLGLTIIASLAFISRNLDILHSVIDANKTGRPEFSWLSMGLLGQISLRILAIYFGAAAMLAGTATAFYSIGEKIAASGQAGGAQLAIATASPGIAAVVAGAIVISVAVTSEIKAKYGAGDEPAVVGGAPEPVKATLQALDDLFKPAQRSEEKKEARE